MSKQMWLVIGMIVVALAVLGVGAFVKMSKSSKSAQDVNLTQPSVEQVSVPTSPPMTQGNLKSLLGVGRNTNCQIVYPDQSGPGTVYVGGSKFRGDFTVKVDAKDMVSHMISDGTYMYIWSEGTPQGTKIKVDTFQNSSPNPSGKAQAVDLNQQVNLNCSDWTVDQSKFILPTGVTFTDLSKLMPKMDKSMCDAITDPQAKEACQKSLGN